MDIQELIEKVNEARATEEELQLYNAYLNRLTKGPLNWEKDTLPQENFVQQHMWAAINREIRPVRKLFPLRRIAAAASLLLLMAAGIYWYYQRPAHPIAGLTHAAADSSSAILTLGNGQTLQLEKVPVGAISKQLQKTNDSTLVYQPQSSTAATTYNTLYIPRGKQFSVILPDGSRVWLNAASTLRYPTTFNNKERRVQLTGEAYFEVAHQQGIPFSVATNAALIEDISTTFNINAYPDEPDTRTTLLTGAVRVSAGNQQMVLQPGQQAVAANGMLTVNNVDATESISWKNGFFTFKKADIQTVMRQFSRWYDIEVKYEGGIPDVAFTGNIYRNMNVAQAMQLLSYFNVNYRIENKTVFIIQ